MKSSSESVTEAARSGPFRPPPLTRPSILEASDKGRVPAAPLAYQGEAIAASLLRQFFRDYPGTLAVRLWSGAPFPVGAISWEPLTEASFVLVFRHPHAISALILGRDPLRLAEAYFRGDVDIEGDLFSALELKNHLEALKIPTRDQFRAVLAAMKLRALNPLELPLFGGNSPPHGYRLWAHSKADSRQTILSHHDVSNDFYRLWLDRSMVYSCAYFERADQSLDDAQTAKLDHICRKLLLRPNETLLDIGCGWGALLIHAAAQYGVVAHGITLSEQQLRLARRRIAEAGLGGRVTVELKDYRDLPKDAFDKVASVGMFEHVGLKNWPLYFSIVQQTLKAGGLFLNHGITHAREGWRKNIATDFMSRYVFPDAELDSIGSAQCLMESSQFEIEDVESLRLHYAMTLRAWVNRLERRYVEALGCVGEATFRVWRLYMAACAQEFESGAVGVYQVLASKRGIRNPQLPLTRHHLYSEH